jgi:hypothetical protein
MDMGRPFPTIGKLVHRWREITIMTAGFCAVALLAYAVHPLFLILIACAACAIFIEKLSWLESRQRRTESLGLPKRRQPRGESES